MLLWYIREAFAERWTDLGDYARKLKEVYMAFDQEGYDVVSVVPIAVGRSEQVLNGIREYLGDVGFSITAGAVVVGKKRE